MNKQLAENTYNSINLCLFFHRPQMRNPGISHSYALTVCLDSLPYMFAWHFSQDINKLISNLKSWWEGRYWTCSTRFSCRSWRKIFGEKWCRTQIFLEHRQAKMFLLGWSIWCVLLTLRMSACVLEISGYDSHEVICSQVLWSTLLGYNEADISFAALQYIQFLLTDHTFNFLLVLL